MAFYISVTQIDTCLAEMLAELKDYVEGSIHQIRDLRAPSMLAQGSGNRIPATLG